MLTIITSKIDTTLKKVLCPTCSSEKNLILTYNRNKDEDNMRCLVCKSKFPSNIVYIPISAFFRFDYYNNRKIR